MRFEVNGFCGRPERPIRSRLMPDKSHTTIHKRQCAYDMRWKGTYPSCVPKTVCPIPEGEDNQINPEFTTVRFNDVFYFNQTKWYAIDGTTVHYQCNSPQTEVLLGDAIHVCKDGQWIGTQPNCFDLSDLKVRKVKNRASDVEELTENK
ncbi:unnamed protein product [Medioppia subpectinata]|uniref:Sushi domain-containing protein n=1 Tax=Medioppia subpectinata TaxID=1979941 RepID=A0A7R9Q2E6_9ACAR|nr:unnamed protein product [Medioppia subpectinata]CAG2110084.1 unnamed protein product [Medioppia subpectinata]